MARLIDADAKITALLYDDEHEETKRVEMTIADFLDSHTEEGCPQSGWISVKDHMPERGTLCFVYDGMRICAARYITGNEWVHGLMLGTVTHWMPMIEPPKEVTPND